MAKGPIYGDYKFPSSFGFRASAGEVPVRSHFRKGGQVKPPPPDNKVKPVFKGPPQAKK